MITLDAIQQAIVDSTTKHISWLFDVNTFSPDATYYWSTKTKSFVDHASYQQNSYTFKIIPDSFSGITLNRAKPELGIQVPNEITFQVINESNTLDPNDFTNNPGDVLVRLIGSKYSITELMTNTGFETYTGTQNDSIEDSFTGWTISGTDGYVDSISVSPHGGTSAIHIRSGATANKQIKQTVSVTAGERYSFSFFGKIGGVALAVGRHAIYDNSNGAWIVIPTANTGIISDTTWNYKKVDFTTPAGCTSIDLILLCNSTASRSVYYDDVSLTYADMELRSWNFSITRCESVYQTLIFTCEDILQRYIEGDYPKKGLVKNLFKSNNNLIQDNYCLPEPFGTAYIPLRVVLSMVSQTLLNSGFEAYAGGAQDDGLVNTFSYWLPGGSDGIADATATVHGGSNALKLIAGVSFDKLMRTIAYFVTPNSIMEWRFWTRGDGTYAGRYKVYNFTQSKDIIAVTSTGVTGTAYTEKIITFLVPEGCYQAQLFVYCPAVNTASAYYDDMTFKRLQEFYLLGPTTNTAGAGVTYTITAQRSPRGKQQAKDEYTSTTYTFTQSTIIDDTSANRRAFINNIYDKTITSYTGNANFGSNDGEHFYDIPTKFTRDDRTSTDPEDIINDIFNDLKGSNYGILDTDSLTTAGATYTSWGLDWTGGLYKAESTAKIVGTILNMCHSTLIMNGIDADLKVLSKTSQKTITSAHVLRTSAVGNGTFKYISISKEVYDSGYVSYQELGEAQDEFIQLLVPCSVGGSTSSPSSTVLELPFINDSAEAQKLGILYFQRLFWKMAEISFSAKTSLLALQPDDVITINGTNYGRASLGDNTTRWDITNPAGTTFRYTYDGTGTDPGNLSTLISGATVIISASSSFNINNEGQFTITGVGAAYFEVANAAGVVESNITLAYISVTCYPVLIDSITIHRDLTLDFKCIQFSKSLNDWEDLSAVTTVTIPTFKPPERNLDSTNQRLEEKFLL